MSLDEGTLFSTFVSHNARGVSEERVGEKTKDEELPGVDHAAITAAGYAVDGKGWLVPADKKWPFTVQAQRCERAREVLEGKASNSEDATDNQKGKTGPESR